MKLDKKNLQRYVYVIKNLINEKVYVGQTCDPNRRKRQHFSQTRKITPLANAIRKHGVENFVFEVLEETTIDLIDIREQFWISHYQSHLLGYNVELGGCAQKTLSISTRSKMSAARKGRSSGMLGKKHSVETIQKMSQIKVGKQPYVMNDEIRSKISHALSGENHPNFGSQFSIETRQKIGRARSQKVELLDGDGNVIATYDSGRIASEQTGVARSSISQKCKEGKTWRKCQV